MTGVHAAKATRRFRMGAWQPIAVCVAPCKFERWAASDKKAAAAAVAHNRDNLPPGTSCDAVTFPRRFAVGTRWPIGLHCAACNWIGDAVDEAQARELAVAHNEGRAA